MNLLRSDGTPELSTANYHDLLTKQSHDRNTGSNRATGREDLFEACCQGKLDIIKKFIPKTPTHHSILNKKDQDYLTLLHYAVRYNHLNIVKYLLACGADPKIRGGTDSVTPLHFAAIYKSSNTVKVHRRQLSDSNLELSPLVEKQQVEPKPGIFSKFQSKSNQKLKERSYDSRGKLIPNLSLSFTKRVEKNDASFSQNESIINTLVVCGADINARNKNDATPLHFAAMRRNIFAAEELLYYNCINIECKDNSWMTPLHYAAEQGCVPIAELLVANGANIDVLNKFDMTPLHNACEEGHPEVARFLLTTYKTTKPDKFSYFINKQDRNGNSALNYAAMSGMTELVSLLLDYGANYYSSTDDNYTTPLHLACVAGNVENVRLLVENNPSIVNAKNRDLETPLHIAASLNRVAILSYLLSCHAELECLDKDLETPLFVASRRDHIESVKLLVAAGASLEHRNDDDYNPLHVAAFHNSLRCAEFLLQSSHQSDLQNSWDRYENRPIHISVMRNHIEMVKLLVENTAPIDSKNSNGFTPLLIAASGGYIDILRYLLEVSPPLALDEDDNNNTALHLAVQNGHYRAVSILVDSGVNIDYRNINQMTALDLACQNGHIKTVAALIEQDASINTSENSKHLSPLLIASKSGHAEVITILLNRGADITKLDPSGRNCIEIAIDENRKEAVLSILNHSSWENALRHVSDHNGVCTSPLRRMIDIMPEQAETVFDKCIIPNGLPKNHPKYQIYCNYEYLEDMHTSWGSSLKSMPRMNEKKQPSFHQRILHNLTHFSKISHFKRSNRSHPLSMIIENNRFVLLSHPLIRYLIRSKWKNSSLYIYYIRIIILLLNIIFLSCLCVYTASVPYKCVEFGQQEKIEKLGDPYKEDLSKCQYCPYIPAANTSGEYLFVSFGKYVVLLLSIVLITQKIFDTYCNFYNFFTFQSLLEQTGVIFALLYVSGLFGVGTKPLEIFQFYRCTNKFRSIGALAICCSWLSFVLFLAKFPKIGIYIVMYTDIFKTFLQFVPVYFMLIITFGLSFFMVFLDRHDTNAYVTPFKAIMKTFLSTVGEIEYDTFYNTPDKPPLNVTYFILFLFLLTNSIILMNLLVGLAVDDIQGVQSKAFLKKLALQVKMIMEFESMLHNSFDKYVLMHDTINPNETKSHPFWSWWEFKSNPFSDDKATNHNNFDMMATTMTEMKDSVRFLKHQLRTVNEKNHKLENMLEELLRRSNDQSQQL